MNNALGMMWKEAIFALFAELSRHLSLTEETRENRQDSRCSDRDLNRLATEYKAGALSLDPPCSVAADTTL
jgi:hypothetical protein